MDGWCVALAFQWLLCDSVGLRRVSSTESALLYCDDSPQVMTASCAALCVWFASAFFSGVGCEQYCCSYCCLFELRCCGGGASCKPFAWHAMWRACEKGNTLSKLKQLSPGPLVSAHAGCWVAWLTTSPSHGVCWSTHKCDRSCPQQCCFALQTCGREWCHHCTYGGGGRCIMCPTEWWNNRSGSPALSWRSVFVC